MHRCNPARFRGLGHGGAARAVGDECINARVSSPLAGMAVPLLARTAQLKHITPEAARSRIQTAIDQYREAQKKSGPESEPEQKKKDKQ